MEWYLFRFHRMHLELVIGLLCVIGLPPTVLAFANVSEPNWREFFSRTAWILQGFGLKCVAVVSSLLLEGMRARKPNLSIIM